MRILGTIVYDEIIIPVTSIVLAHGLFILHGHIDGPHPKIDARGFSLHGSDGVLVACSQETLFATEAQPEGIRTHVMQPVCIVDKELSRIPHQLPELEYP